VKVESRQVGGRHDARMLKTALLFHVMVETTVTGFKCAWQRGADLVLDLCMVSRGSCPDAQWYALQVNLPLHTFRLCLPVSCCCSLGPSPSPIARPRRHMSAL
jgi:hypothetical protein